MVRIVQPSLGKASFSCPHCHALAQQFWYKNFLVSPKKGEVPHVPSGGEIPSLKCIDPQKKLADVVRVNTISNRRIALFQHEYNEYTSLELLNLNVSCCFSCRQYSVWVVEDLVYPRSEVTIVPHDDMPEQIKSDFLEAASILSLSPRGAAALLRLSIQKLMPILGEKGKDVSTDIAELVKKGLPSEIQMALDTVRVIGNEAVHPGQIDMKDNAAMAGKLFQLVNFIIQKMISEPKQIKELYQTLPETKLQAIADRDKSSSGSIE